MVPIQGITVTTELPGVVRDLRFDSGQTVQTGATLLRLDTGVEASQLASAEAQRALARVNLERARKLEAAGVAAKAELDTAEAMAKQRKAEVSNIGVMLGKKTIKAPFTGRLGIRQVSNGQYVTPGTPIVTLLDTSRVYVDFRLPQRHLPVVSAEGIVVRITSDAFPGKKWEGKIDAVDAAVESASRNLRLRAVFDNPKEELAPGMFVNVEVVLPTKQNVVVIPVTAVQYAPYGDSVFVVEESPEGPVVKHTFIRQGTRRGDLAVVSSGVQSGQIIVTSGGFKLKNGARVVVDNKLAPDAKVDPKPQDK